MISAIEKKEILTTDYKPLIIESEVKTMDEKIIEMFSAIQNDISSMKIQIDERFSKLESELAEIKEDTEITRSAVSRLNNLT